MLKSCLVRCMSLCLPLLMLLPAIAPAAPEVVKIGLNYPATGPYAKQGSIRKGRLI